MPRHNWQQPGGFVRMRLRLGELLRSNPKRNINKWIRTVLAVAAYVLYGSAVLVLERAEPSAWTIETESGLPAAVSYAIYGTKPGSIDRNVFTLFNSVPVREAIKQTATGTM